MALALVLGTLPRSALASPWVSIAASAAPAAGGDDEVDPETKRLKQLYDEAHVAFLAGRYLDAAGKFDDGYKSSGLTAFLFNAAVAWERGGNLDQAVERYAEYLVKEPDSADAKETERRLQALRDAIAGQKEAQVGELRTKGVAVITTKPAGAEIRLDDPRGKVFATTPFQGTLPPGEHVVHVSAKGFKPDTKAVPDNTEKMLIVHFSLSEEYFLGHLEIKSPVDGADIRLRQLADVDGNPVPEQAEGDAPVGKTPFSNQVPPGTYQVQVTKEGYVDHQEQVEVKQGKVKTINVDLQPVAHVILKLVPKNPESKGAEVTLVSGGNKKPLCTLPCETTLPPGEHTILVKKKKMKQLKFDVKAKAADLVAVDVTLQPATRRYGAIVTGILMAGTAATGIVFGLRAKDAEEALQKDIDNYEQVDRDDPRAKTGKRDAIIADAMFGATALLGALTLFYLLRQTGKPSTGKKEQRDLAQRRFNVTPALGRTRAGVVGEVRF